MMVLNDQGADLTQPKLLSFVEVYTVRGACKRFAAGTKARFAIARINQTNGAEENKNYSFIVSDRDGEEAVEFGPDATLVNYGEGWRLRAVEDAQLSKSLHLGVNKWEAKAKQEVNGVTRPDPKRFDPSDYYPGGKLPQGGPPADSLTYTRNLLIVMVIIFGIAGFWVYVLERVFSGDK